MSPHVTRWPEKQPELLLAITKALLDGKAVEIARMDRKQIQTLEGAKNSLEESLGLQ